MMSVLLMQLIGPMQSWGLQSRFTNRDTAREPTKSGVVGLLCAASGIRRDDEKSISDIASLRVGVRVDREGVILKDFQTAGGGTQPGKKKYGVYKASGKRGDTVISQRFYLSDAAFLVALEGQKTLLVSLAEKLENPVWPIYLGRKSYVPAEPVLYNATPSDVQMERALTTIPWLKPAKDTVQNLRLILECPADEGSPCLDVPVSFKPRQFKLRYVKTEWVSSSELS